MKITKLTELQHSPMTANSDECYWFMVYFQFEDDKNPGWFHRLHMPVFFFLDDVFEFVEDGGENDCHSKITKTDIRNYAKERCYCELAFESSPEIARQVCNQQIENYNNWVRRTYH